MSDPGLAARLATLAIPAARFQLLSDTGHQPQQETPGQVLHAIERWLQEDEASLSA
jgi:pimeloyl-ACP methyl ester carboxylesterase